jgi:hypothetical protein
MTETAQAPALLDQARAALERVNALAGDARAQDLVACRPHLEQAVSWLERAMAAAGNTRAKDYSRALDRFRRELHRTGVLHEHAGAFYCGLIRVFAPGSAYGYSAHGEETWRVPPGRRVSLEA